MSTKLFSLPVCCILLITAGCGHKVDVSTAFSFPVETVKSFAERTSISSTMSEWAATQYEHAACDSLIVSFEPRESFLFSLTDLRTGDLIGTYCHKGRSDQEPSDILPHFVPYVDEGEFIIDFLLRLQEPTQNHLSGFPCKWAKAKFIISISINRAVAMLFFSIFRNITNRHQPLAKFC